MSIKRIAITIGLLISIVAGYFFCFHRFRSPRHETDQEYKWIWEAVFKLHTEGHRKEAFQLVDSIYKKIPVTPFALYEKYIHLSTIYEKDGKLDKKLEYTDSALYILELNKMQDEYPVDYGHSLLSKGDALVAIHNYSLACDVYFKARRFVENKTTQCYMNEYSYSLGMAFYKQKKYKEAAVEFETGFLEAVTCEVEEPLFRMQEFLSNTALCFTKLKMTDSALFYYDSVISFINTHSRDFGEPYMAQKAIGVVYGNMADIYFGLGRVDTAELLMKKSIVINDQPFCENNDAQKTKIKLANLYYVIKQPALMLKTLNGIRKSLDTLPDIDVENDWKKLMYLYYDYKKEPLKSINYYRSYIETRDSLTKNNSDQLQTDVLQELREKDQEYQIQLLKKDKELSLNFLFGTIAFSFLVLAIVGLVYSSYLKSRKKNILISTQKEALEQSNREKDRILNVVAHDLRSPVSGIAYIAELMLEEGAAFNADESFTMIRKSAISSLSLINELIGFSGDENDDLKKDWLDLRDIVEEVISSLQLKAVEKKLVIQAILPDHEIKALLNRDKIARVINNLVVNAIKFTNEGGSIWVKLIENNGKAILSVKDEGIGIPSKLLPQLFEMFTAAKRTGTGGEKSFGLGLSISKKIVEAHGGRIWVESTEGAGSTFLVELPV